MVGPIEILAAMVAMNLAVSFVNARYASKAAGRAETAKERAEEAEQIAADADRAAWQAARKAEGEP